MLSIERIARIIVGPRRPLANDRNKRTLEELQEIRWNMEAYGINADAIDAAKAILRAIDDAERERVAGKTYRTLGSVISAEVYESSRMAIFRIKLHDASEAVLPYTVNVDTPFGQHRIAQLLNASGLKQITDTDETHGIEFIVNHRMGAVRKLECAVLTQFIQATPAEPRGIKGYLSSFFIRG